MTTVACLLPVRNGAADLPAWFESVSRVADFVIALDDGSTDGTAEILRNHPLVECVLRNPVRTTYEGWDDAANRERLLEAAHALRPDWVLSLDADERIDAADAVALRRFIEEDALPRCAYGFQVHRMIDDLTHFDKADLWVYRLFAREDGQTFSQRRLHFVPIPSAIPRERWLRTTVRIQHVASLTPERRSGRYEKYAEADPQREFQEAYEDLLDPPGELSCWEPRRADAPVLVARDATTEANAEDLDLDGPVLSAVVISQNDEDRIEEVVGAVVSQVCPVPFEVIVVTSGTDRTAAIVRERFPTVTLVELDRPALPGAARNAGWRLARGDYVSFPGSHVVLPPGSLAARVAAHEDGWPMVTGTTRNGNTTAAGWASYFLDNSTALPGRPSGELSAAPAHCSYARHALKAAGGFPEDMRAGEDTVVNRTLFARGFRAFRSQDIELIHRNRCDTARQLVAHHFNRGRALARILLDDHRHSGRLLRGRRVRSLLVQYIPRRLTSTDSHVEQWGGDVADVYRRVRPLVVAGTIAAWAGCWYEMVRPAPGKRRVLFGTPGTTLLVGGLDARRGEGGGRTDATILVRIEFSTGRVRAVSLPRDLLVPVPGHAQRRINEAHHLGYNDQPRVPGSGERLLVRTVRDALEIAVDSYVLLDFVGFRRLIDAAGGVVLDIDEEIHDDFDDEHQDLWSAHFTPGREWMSGRRALAYARTRATGGDSRRRDHQMQVLTAAFDALTAVRRPAQVARVLVAGRRAVRTDLRVRDMARIGWAMLRAGRSAPVIDSVGWPLVVDDKLADGSWVVRGDLSVIARHVRTALGLD